MNSPGGSRLRSVARALTPPLIVDAARRLVGRWRQDRIRFEGDYASWAEASAAADGYDAPVILEQTIQATRKVRRGDAAFQRDGVVFQEIEYNYPLAFSLLRAALRHRRLHVVDFGGALGCTYDQHRRLLGTSVPVRWAVVEQPSHVAAGRREFAGDELTFHETIEEAHAGIDGDVLLLSGVLQCLPDPPGFVRAIADLGFGSVILDRTPFSADERARLTVQRVPAWIHAASYPAWFLAQDVLEPLAGAYETVASWAALDDLHPEGGRAEWHGYLFERRR
jgi:putative methyltransferase (TIGR04325 family)